MKCPSCGASLKEDASICFSCGRDLTKEKDEVDQLLDDMINEGEEEKDIESKQEQKPKKEGSLAFQLVTYLTLASILAFAVTLLFDWFAVFGRGGYEGLIKNETSRAFLSESLTGLSREEIHAYPDAVVFFSPKDLLDYIRSLDGAYQVVNTSKGTQTTSIVASIHGLYIYLIYGVVGAVALSLAILLIDKKQKITEVVRVMSLLSLGYIGLNYLAIKISYFSMFAIHTQSILRTDDLTNAVNINKNGIQMNNIFYPYRVAEKPAFFVALGALGLWFLLSTVLIELRKEKEDTTSD